MPRLITEWDLGQQQVEGYPITVADRREKHETALQAHLQHRQAAPARLPGTLELILQPQGAHGLALAADRLLRLYEAGVPVISDAGLLFGERLLPDDLENWDALVKPGQAVCLTDFWYTTIIPRMDIPTPWSPQSAYPPQEAWRRILADQAVKIQSVTAQGSLVVLVLSPTDLHPVWTQLADCPMVHVYMSSLLENSYLLGHLVARDVHVRYQGGIWVQESEGPYVHSYERVTRERLWEALPLVSLSDG